MKRIEKIGYVVALGIIILLLLVSSTDWFLKDEGNKVYNVAVILNEQDDENYVNCKKGIDKASEVYNIDVSYKTLYDQGNPTEQEEMIEEAVDNGANAVVVAPVDAVELEEYLNRKKITVPVITLKTKLENEQVESSITGKYLEMGTLLSQDIIKEAKESETVVRAFAGDLSSEEVKGLYQVMVEEFKKKQLKIDLIEYTEEVNSFLKNQELIVALDQKALSQISETKNTNRIFGVGYNNKLLQYLKEGKLKGLALYNEYDLGYRAMEHAVGLINRKMVNKHTQLESLLIHQEDVYKQEYEAILFPIS